MIDKIKAVVKSAGLSFEYGVVPAFFNFFQGRATTFAIVFTTVGIWLAVHGKLSANYVALVTAVQGLVFAHSVKEDWMQRPRG